jgi:hypothetical protein
MLAQTVVSYFSLPCDIALCDRCMFILALCAVLNMSFVARHKWKMQRQRCRAGAR